MNMTTIALIPFESIELNKVIIKVIRQSEPRVFFPLPVLLTSTLYVGNPFSVNTMLFDYRDALIS